MIQMDRFDPVGEAKRLTPDEDAILRRLHFFEQSGISLAEPMRVLKAELRARDQRAEIREPEYQRILWPIAG